MRFSIKAIAVALIVALAMVAVPGWAGAYAVVGFTGTTVKLRQRNGVDLYASIDGGAWVSYKNVKGTVNLTPNRLPSGTHTLRLSYRQVSGSYRGDPVFQGVIPDSGAHTIVPSVPSRIIEFVGMRDRYLKTGLSTTTPDWDFSRYQASDVVINLGTNDLGHNVPSSQFQTAYSTLLQRIRAKYPNAGIYAMETFKKWYVNETKAAVTARNNAGDSKVRYISTEGWINPATDTADGTHPNDGGHQKIATRLAAILR
ncbi:GDSL-type esterase/lipase family protein [Crossiella sp. NPDC003009]